MDIRELTKINSMDARIAHWKQEWKMPGLSLSLQGYSRAAYRTGFYVPELNILLDAGPTSLKNPSHIFVTHSHIDHVAGLPFTLIRTDEMQRFIVFGPTECENHIKKYVASMFELNMLSSEVYDPYDDRYDYVGHNTPSKFRVQLKKSLYDVDVVLCDHTVPTISYCFSEIRNKLKEEFSGLSGSELKALRQSGESVTCERAIPTFAYICDTTTAVLERFPIILDFPIVIIECTFLYDNEREQAISTKHVHWEQLQPFVLAYPSTTFVLIHFSMRYTEEEILRFFIDVKSKTSIDNIKIWAGDTMLNIS